MSGRRRPPARARRRARFAIAACAALLTALGACAEGPPPAEPRDVLVVTLDTTRADVVSCYGEIPDTTPCVDALAARGVLFENAYAPMALTLPSHTSLFTGLTPRRHGALENGASVDEALETMAEELAARGYRTGAFVGARVLGAFTNIDQGFEVFEEPKPVTEGGKQPPARPGAQVVDEAITWWRGLAPDERGFAWVHFYDAHGPHVVTPGYEDAIDPVAVQRFVGAQPQFRRPEIETPLPQIANLWHRYATEVRYTDDQLARLLEELEGLGRLERTLVVIVGDHGEGLHEHANRGHGESVYEEQVRVPLVVAPPPAPERGGVDAGVDPDVPLRGRRVAARTPVREVFPLVLDLARGDGVLAAPWDALARGAEPREPVIVVERPHFPQSHDREARSADRAPGLYVGLLHDRYKLVRYPSGDEALFDLAADPDELEDVSSTHPDIAARMVGLLEEWLSGHAVAPRAASELDDDRRAVLEELGYLGAGDDG